jgi:hypothetical protein
MPVTVDHQPLPTETLGLQTVGQVLAHLQQQDRFVVNVLIDGEEPDLNKLGSIKQSSISGHTLFIETAEPREMAIEVLDAVETQLDEADRLKHDAVEALQANQLFQAMQKLSGCFTTWQHAEESVTKIAQLLRIDLTRIQINGTPFNDVLCTFEQELRSIRSALENRDYVGLCDILTYETTETSNQWRAALDAMRNIIN